MNIHKLYRGKWARPGPAVVTHVAGIAAFCFALGIHGSIALNIACFFAGWIAWTLFEYSLHQFILHSRNRWLWRTFHHEHHTMRSMNNAEHRFMHPLFAAPLMAAVVLAASKISAPLILPLGFWFGYVAYELIHWVDHTDQLRTPLSRFAYFKRRLAFHDTHHFRRANVHYGFSTDFWDALFGTWYAPEPVRGSVSPAKPSSPA